VRLTLGYSAVAALALTSAVAAAQNAVISPGPDAVSVTVYRDPERRGGGELDLENLAGFALITETRTVSVPAGASEIRFEGVAEGIVPVSAIVKGLPGGVIEKNRDARLLSPAALVDGTLGKRVHLRRTNRITGAASEEDATILSGPAGGVILRTKGGIEALGCSGLPETLIYDAVPQGLTDKPTLSVTTRSPSAATATVQLSYLASGFDWSANYVARVAEDGTTLDLFAWLTLANSNGESFIQANTQAVAGTLNRDENAADLEQSSPQPQLQLACWGSSLEQVQQRFEALAAPAPMMVMKSMGAIAEEDAADNIIVTAMRAEQEELGDLKLYRIPEPVTVAANAQKQVALLEKQRVPFERIYTRRFAADSTYVPSPSNILLRMKNTTERGLGLPLPSGGIAVFEPGGGTQLLIGETRMRDIALGEDVEIEVGESAQVQVEVAELDQSDRDFDRKIERYEVRVTNANPAPVTVEIRLNVDAESYTLEKPSAKLGRKNGDALWTARVPANGTAKLSYVLREVEDLALGR
jgi:hypothetical protein